MLKRLTALALAAALLLSLFGCSFEPPAILEDGAANFADGKEEENYSPVNSGALLESLIGKYSGSYYDPTGTPMGDAEYGDAQDQIGGIGGESSVYQVANWEDLQKMLHQIYAETGTFVEFEITDPNFQFDPAQDLNRSYRTLQREDPVYVGSVEGWSWGQTGSRYLLKISYNIDVTTLIAMKKQTEDLVDQAVAALNATGKSDYEIICAVNDYLCDTVYYPASEPYAPETHTAYGAFVNGVAVCEGYALAAKLMLNEFGIPCDIQTGDCIGGGGHAWNLVQLDGQWYQMDVTWNDGSESRQDYLLVTDAYMRKSRTWDYGDYPASAPEPYKP